MIVSPTNTLFVYDKDLKMTHQIIAGFNDKNQLEVYAHKIEDQEILIPRAYLLGHNAIIMT